MDFVGVTGRWGGLAASSEVSGNANAGCFAFLLAKVDDDNWGCGRSGDYWVVLSVNDVSPLSYLLELAVISKWQRNATPCNAMRCNGSTAVDKYHRRWINTENNNHEKMK